MKVCFKYNQLGILVAQFNYILFLSVKKSYYRLARIHHPDKSSETHKLSAEKFNIIHQAYMILSNAESRMKYDAEGSKVIFARATMAAEWENYLKTTNVDDLINASTSYKGSAEERADILKEAIAGNGSMIHILNNIPFMRKEDETRIIQIIQEAFITEEIPRIAIKKLPKGY